jgi:hypothetical protein
MQERTKPPNVLPISESGRLMVPEVPGPSELCPTVSVLLYWSQRLWNSVVVLFIVSDE